MVLSSLALQGVLGDCDGFLDDLMVVDVGEGGRGEDQGDRGEEFEGGGAGEPVAVVGEV